MRTSIYVTGKFFDFSILKAHRAECFLILKGEYYYGNFYRRRCSNYYTYERKL